jgi:hypothetical protein
MELSVVLAFLLLLVIVWIIVGIVGFVIHGLFWLFVLACVFFLLTLVGSAFGRGRKSGRVGR